MTQGPKYLPIDGSRLVLGARPELSLAAVEGGRGRSGGFPSQRALATLPRRPPVPQPA